VKIEAICSSEALVFSKLHGVATQKTVNFIVTAEGALNPTRTVLVYRFGTV
jgi:hypothetical protein